MAAGTDKAGPAGGDAEATDAELLTLHRSGKPGPVEGQTALETLILRYERDLFFFLLRFVNDRATADDLFQETFLQVHKSAATFDAEKRFRPWLFTIGANKARDHLRRNKRHRALPLDAKVGGAASDGASFVDLMEADLPEPGSVAAEGEVAVLVRDAVSGLPDHLREVLTLAYFEKLAYREIAEMLGIPLGTVKSRLHAAVAAFAIRWKETHPKIGPSARLDPE
ncbi:RNA polymerase sigma factor [Phycisphaera mikurensis]|uniref:RNA polymerase ECF-type sigma factor n=1 Tax=Phycisphaera mikurensis (strain NBRC 102666 / KCTC 22515 / FYK2301M01) TaxID=1142394 RepID=I0IB72_PHYMF|nr:sigma-70 family RNA polymerase sigma factor [Phycisphaera mikurensis]MBB6443009.1 RNA polymerase sigma-70 factor (ECF subfamily) [Phycisphaera mikurensis]BAM02510.1 RNA polymerase ECF-type sigma factor [Phycisphaera mikurensis NBRC 102666]